MSIFISARMRRSRAAVAVASLSAFAALGAILVLAGSSAAAPPTAVGLGSANDFAILAGSGISDVPTSSITGNVGLDPAAGSFITGLTCAEVHGTIYTNNASGPACRRINGAALVTVKNDLSTAYNDAAGRTVPLPNVFSAGDKQLDGLTLAPGVYQVGGAASANLSTSLTLSGSASSVWIFQATSDLVFGSGSTVTMTGGASACNVFWQVNSSATIGTGASISGTILALSSITANTGASIDGRLLAENGLVSLQSNTINASGCGVAAASSPTQQPPGRAIYCAPNGQTYDLVAGEDKLPPYDALNLVPAHVDPVTGSESCSPQVVTTTTSAATTTAAATTTTTAATPPPPPVAPSPTPKKASTPKAKAGVKAATTVRAKHVAPQPAKHTSGFTG